MEFNSATRDAICRFTSATLYDILPKPTEERPSKAKPGTADEKEKVEDDVNCLTIVMT